MKGKKIFVGLVVSILAVVSLGLLSADTDGKRFEISKGLNIFSKLFSEVNLLYVDEVEPEEMIRNGIDAMLKSLDPYTVYYPESKIEEFNMMLTGEYAGIGSIISMKNDYVVIREPYKNSPSHKAGLLPGDKIVAIDGEDMKGKSVEYVSSKLKGQPGKELIVKVKRIGESKEMEKKIIREIVQLPTIPYYGKLNDTTGYLYLTSFTDKAAEDMRRVILDLKAKGATSLVFDMRGNGGGLLDQAVEIVNLFLPRGSLIVSTKGKRKEWDSEYVTRRNPLVPNMRLAILIDRGSASAAEIVAGSLQDYDRAVIIGERSFGKGLVQATRDLVYNTKLKVTTAKYYIPSGRCIQAVDYTHRNPDGSVGKVPDSLMTEFKTKAGRKVYDGGGIMPDIEVELPKYTKVTQELVIKDCFFDFVNEYASQCSTITSPALFNMSDDIYDAFKTYLKRNEFVYETASQKMVENLIETAKAEKYYDQISAKIEILKKDLEHTIDRDLNVFRTEIESILSDQLMERYYMQEGVIEYHTRSDANIAKAIEVLSNIESYQKILQ